MLGQVLLVFWDAERNEPGPAGVAAAVFIVVVATYLLLFYLQDKQKKP